MFIDGLTLLPSANAASSASQLQLYYEWSVNLLSLSTKRTLKRSRVERWSSHLPPDDVQALIDKKETGAFLSARAATGSSRHKELLVTKKKELELLITSLMKKALEIETDRLSAAANDHTEA